MSCSATRQQRILPKPVRRVCGTSFRIQTVQERRKVVVAFSQVLIANSFRVLLEPLRELLWPENKQRTLPDPLIHAP